MDSVHTIAGVNFRERKLTGPWTRDTHGKWHWAAGSGEEEGHFRVGSIQPIDYLINASDHLSNRMQDSTMYEDLYDSEKKHGYRSSKKKGGWESPLTFTIDFVGSRKKHAVEYQPHPCHRSCIDR